MTGPSRFVLGTRIEPLILGLPPYFAWNVAWVLLTFLALLGYHLLAGGERDE